MKAIFILLGLALYFAPAIMAFHNKRRDAWAVAVFNLLLGWSLIGWIIAALLARKDKTHESISS
jgi:uncharacterized membrane protein